jgi:ribosome-associated protein
MPKRAAPHRGTDVHYGDNPDAVADDDVDARPSKTQLKQKSQELQDLGVAVSELSAERLAAIEMPDRLREAIETFRKTRSHEGKRRQMQYVGKLMRSADEEALREAVAAATLGSAKETLMLHDTERWRAELMAHDDAMTRWLQLHPHTDTQQLRSLVRQARRDAAGLAPEARQPKSFRELFLFIKPMMQATHV